MWPSVFRMLMKLPLLRPIIKPIVRFIVGALAIPLFRLFLRRVVRLQDLDAELEKDLEQWFRAALVLLVATRNMEETLFPFLQVWEKGDWVGMGLRVMLAIGVIELMPDQELFAVIHPGPPRVHWQKGIFKELREKWWDILKGVVCQHLNRSSPVFAILAAVADGWVGWFCYSMALIQYLIIGLVTSKDKAMNVLSEFDRQVARRRRELVEEFHLGDSSAPSALEGDGTSDAPEPQAAVQQRQSQPQGVDSQK